MKTKAVLSTAILVVVAFALTAPVVGQNLHGSGLTIHWQIFLRGDSVNTWALAEYDAFTPSIAPSPSPKETVFTRFTVTATTPALENGTKLGVFLGPSTGVNEPYGKLVGIIDVNDGAGGMVLIGAKVPTIQKGTTVTVTNIGRIPNRPFMVLKGTF
jgi:hypothetical protein